jgi:hypothetical protein
MISRIKNGGTMLKHLLVLVLLGTAGCQSGKNTAGRSAAYSFNGNPERLVVWLEKYVDTYDVAVHRAVLTFNGATLKDDWVPVASAVASGYPGAWRKSAEGTDIATDGINIQVMLDGEQIAVPLSRQARVVAKVIPDTENTARVVGVYVQGAQPENGLAELCVPFDIRTGLGKLSVIYLRSAN